MLACSGFHADGYHLAQRLLQNIEMYKAQHQQDMSTESLAQLLSTILYSKRFFPYYAFCILGGVDEEGVGCVYSYDPVGSFERRPFQAAGSGSQLIQPFLDNIVGKGNQQGVTYNVDQVSLDWAKKVVDDGMTSATERDIHTGDAYQLFVVTKDGVQLQGMPLKKD